MHDCSAKTTRICRIRRQVSQDLTTGGRDVRSHHRRPPGPAVTSESGTPRRVGGEHRATSIDNITLSGGGRQDERSPSRRSGWFLSGSFDQLELPEKDRSVLHPRPFLTQPGQVGVEAAGTCGAFTGCRDTLRLWLQRFAGRDDCDLRGVHGRGRLPSRIPSWRDPPARPWPYDDRQRARAHDTARSSSGRGPSAAKCHTV